MVQISKKQLASMIILFEIGSSPLFLLAGEAKRDAWIAVAIAMLAGLALLLFVTLPIQRQEPDKNLAEICRLYLGPYLGYLIAGAYAFYFIYSSMRNVREFGELTNLYLLPATPLAFIMAVLVFTSGYAIYKGLEVFFRVAEFILPIVMIVYVLMFATFIMTGLIHLDRLLPIFAEGIRPVVSAALPEYISFPFGEVFVFTFFWKYMKDKEKITSISLMAYSLAGLFIILTNMILIVTLGPLAATGGIPMMLVASFVRIARLAERMDPLVIMLLYMGVFMKQTAYYLGTVLALQTMTKRISYKRLVVLVGLFLYAFSFYYRNQTEQVYIGFELNMKYHFPVFVIILPIFIVLVMKLRRKLTKA